jgi:hypothetical protein
MLDAAAGRESKRRAVTIFSRHDVRQFPAGCAGDVEGLGLAGEVLPGDGVQQGSGPGRGTGGPPRRCRSASKLGGEVAGHTAPRGAAPGPRGGTSRRRSRGTLRAPRPGRCGEGGPGPPAGDDARVPRDRPRLRAPRVYRGGSPNSRSGLTTTSWASRAFASRKAPANASSRGRSPAACSRHSG